jgi:uncharacterized membrane protein
MAATPSPGAEITDNDKLLAALSYPIPIVAIVILLVEEMKARPFQKYHAVQALAFNVVLWVIIFLAEFVLVPILAVVTLGFGAVCGCIPPLLWLVTLWPAIKAYQGEYMELPVITDFIKNQKWV